jgi:hypothetical protein
VKECGKCGQAEVARKKSEKYNKHLQSDGITRHGETSFSAKCKCGTVMDYSTAAGAYLVVQGKTRCNQCVRKENTYLFTNPDEVWKPIDGFNYEVSNMGRVRNSITYGLLAPQPVGIGYRGVFLYRDGEPHQEYIHRLVLTAFKGAPTVDRPDCNHIDADRTNNKVSNLEWVSVKENIAHAIKLGHMDHLKPKPSRLTKAEYDYIRSSREKARVLGDRFDMSVSWIEKLRSGAIVPKRFKDSEEKSLAA